MKSKRNIFMKKKIINNRSFEYDEISENNDNRLWFHGEDDHN
jgi:hypothetical protein